jgi:hypothetical protein
VGLVLDWIRENLGAKAADLAALDDGSRLRLAIPELRLNGYADILAIEACPEIADGPGEVVTATYQTDRAAVVDLRFAGSSRPIGTTAGHPFWRITRQDFVDAGDLEIGETVVALDGQHFRLTSITPRAGSSAQQNDSSHTRDAAAILPPAGINACKSQDSIQA